jgi:uncharacterized membrane protein YfcA
VAAFVSLWSHGTLVLVQAPPENDSGSIGGGYGGAWGAQRLPQAWVRRFVTAIGALMTAYFFARLY